MILWLILIPYLLVGVFSIRPVAGQLAYSMFANDQAKYPRLCEGRTKPNNEQWFGALCTATLIAIIWPLALLVFLSPGRLGAEKAAKLKAAEERLARMERELGLSPSEPSQWRG